MTVLVFVLAKIVFMLANKEGHSFMPADIWDVIRHGLSLDGSTALYFLSVPLLMVIATIWVKGAKARKVMKRIMSVYFIIVSLAFSLAFIAEAGCFLSAVSGDAHGSNGKRIRRLYHPPFPAVSHHRLPHLQDVSGFA